MPDQLFQLAVVQLMVFAWVVVAVGWICGQGAAIGSMVEQVWQTVASCELQRRAVGAW